MKKQEKIEHAEKEKEERQASYFIYAIVFIVIFIALIFSIRYFFPAKQEIQQYSYNGFIFTNIGGLWYTEILKEGTNKSYSVPLHFSPSELGNVTIEGDVNAFKNKTEIFLTFDPNAEEFSYIALSASEVSINLAQTLNITPIAACTSNETPACTGRLVVDCKNPGPPAIYFSYSNYTRVYVQNNCIFVQGFRQELVRATDRLLLKWFSIMP